MLTEAQKKAIADTYCPLLVLYPEIRPNSHRKDHHRHGHRRTRQAPLTQDYHPRGIELVLDHAYLPELGAQKPSREEILAAMSRDKNRKLTHIDLVRGVGPGNVAKFWEVYAAISKEDREAQYPRKAYARIVEGSEQYQNHLIIQYWLAYFFDDWANVHEMDWEMAAVVLKRTAGQQTPVACAYRAHVGNFRLAWPEVQKVDNKKKPSEAGTHPVVYVANGSHACYFEYRSWHDAPGTILGPKLSRRLRKWIPWIKNNLGDYVMEFDKGDTHFPEIDVMPEPGTDKNGDECWQGEWRWLNFKGRWGTKGKFWWRPKQLFTLPWEETGAPALACQDVYWEDPFRSIDFPYPEPLTEPVPDAESWILSLDC